MNVGICTRCGIEVTFKQGRVFYCNECRQIVKEEKKQLRKIGNCAKCNAEFTFISKAKYCLDCRKKVSLESARKLKNFDWIDDVRRLTNSGYVLILQNDKWIPEHRFVMEKMINRSLRKGESVHHKNGIRNDNSEANLELWVGPIKNGQRAIDICCPSCNVSYWDATITK